MITTFKDNRILPPLIIAVCLWLFYSLIDPSVQRFGSVIQVAADHTTLDTARVSQPIVSKPPQPNGHRRLVGDDVLLIMKTGGTSMYYRLLVHLVTSLSPERISLSNVVIYSDYPETIGNFTILDVLANLTTATQSHPDFDIYRALPQYVANNVYSESAGVEGDDDGPVGGWVLDKYKFLPIIDHAGKTWPRARWYIYMEDDTYLFLPNVLTYLSSFDWMAPHYLGGFAFKANVTFAHGGSGFALSRGAWEQSFGQNLQLVENFQEYTHRHGCGDQILGHALNEYGVRFGENGGDEKFSWGFNGVAHWKFAFRKWNWCKPLLSWHKVHNRDVARYYELEKTWDFQIPMRYGDFFQRMIAPDLKKRREWWDNISDLFEITSANAGSPPAPQSEYNARLWAEAWHSVDACEAACESWSECMQWSYYEDRCRLDDRLIMGSGYAPTMRQRKTSLMITSGWLIHRLGSWECK